MRIKKGDTVFMISGDEKGKRGKVLKLFAKERRAIVEGVNFIQKHSKARRSGEQSRIIEKEAPVHLSNLALVCPKCGKHTKVGVKILKDRRKVRICKRCEEMIED